MTSKRQISAIFSVLLSILLMIPENITVFAEDGTESGQNQEDVVLAGGESETESEETTWKENDVTKEDSDFVAEDNESGMTIDSLEISSTDNTLDETDALGEIKTADAGDSRYVFYPVSEVSSWSAAEAFCKALGGHLAVISSAEENSLIFSLMKEAGYNNAYFGYTDCENEGEWHWIDGYTSSYVNWAPTEPNCSNSKEDYAMFYSSYSDGTWNDGDFSAHTNGGDAAFICEFGDNDTRTVNVSPIWPEPGMKNVYCNYHHINQTQLNIVLKIPTGSEVESLAFNNNNLKVMSQNGSIDFDNASDYANMGFSCENGKVYLTIIDNKGILEPGFQITVSIFEDFIKFKNEPNKKTAPFSWAFTLTNINALTDTNCFGNRTESTGMTDRTFKTYYGKQKEKQLFEMAKNAEKDNIRDAQNEPFHGICYGTTMTQALLLSNRIGLSELTDNKAITNYHELDPNVDYYFRDNLVYYYMLQKINQFSSKKVSFATLNKGKDSTQFFEQVAAKLEEGELVPLFIEFNEMDMHTILLYSIDVTYDGGYQIYFLDPNNYNPIPFEIDVSTDDNSFSFPVKIADYKVQEDYKNLYAFDLNVYDSILKNPNYVEDPPNDSISYVSFRDKCTTIVGIDGFEYRNDPSCILAS